MAVTGAVPAERTDRIALVLDDASRLAAAIARNDGEQVRMYARYLRYSCEMLEKVPREVAPPGQFSAIGSG